MNKNYLEHKFNPLTVTNKEAKLSHQSSINWHDYAELRKPFLPDIFTKSSNFDTEKSVKLQHKSRASLAHHRS